jgi:citrate lyase subunit beta-like protein
MLRASVSLFYRMFLVLLHFFFQKIKINSVLRLFDSKANMKLLACIESALGLLNIREIIASDKRVDGLVFAAEDYCTDTGILRTKSRKELLYARQKVVSTACAFGVQCIDLVCVDYQNEATLKEECEEGRSFGFSGKQAIHPSQISLIHASFSPSEKEIEKAKKIVELYEEHVKKGVGAFSLDGHMIDMPIVKKAIKLLSRVKS